MKTLALFSTLAICVPYYECGGGMSDHSVTVPGEDGVYVKATAESKGTRATISMHRSTSKVHAGGEKRYFIDKTLIEQKLTLAIGESKDSFFEVETHDAASSFAEHKLEFSPESDRLAYKLGERPWHVIYLLPPHLAVHSYSEFPSLDWAKVPRFEDAFIELYKGQELKFDGLYHAEKNTMMLEWIKTQRGEDALAEQLFRLLNDDDYTWDDRLKMLSSTTRKKLGQRLFAEIAGGATNPRYYSKAWKLRAFDLEAPENVAFVSKGVELLRSDKNTLMNRGDDLAAYMKGLARTDLSAVATLSCQLLTNDDPPYSLLQGRPLQAFALAALAAQREQCPAVKSMTVDPCAEASLCDGKPCTAEKLASAVGRELATSAKYVSRDAAADDNEALRAKLVLANHAWMGLHDPSNPADCGE